MKKSASLKNKLKKNELTIGSWITIGHPSIAEIMAKVGFDWLTVDMEHSDITLHQAQELIRVIDLCGVTALVRVGENSPNLIKRVMDAGAHGVIVPMVNTKEEAQKAVNAVKYPPYGTRGVGLARAQGYGLAFEPYLDWVRKESVVIVQIEHIQAVENLEEILWVEGVDAFLVGPYDLSGSMGRPGDLDHPEMISALKRIAEVSKRLKKTMGFHVVPPKAETVVEKIREGYRLIAYCVDFLFLIESCRNGLGTIREGLKKMEPEG